MDLAEAKERKIAQELINLIGKQKLEDAYWAAVDEAAMENSIDERYSEWDQDDILTDCRYGGMLDELTINEFVAFVNHKQNKYKLNVSSDCIGAYMLEILDF